MLTRTPSTYSELLRRVKAADLLRKTPGFYVRTFALVTAASLAVWGLLILTALTASGWGSLLAIPLVVAQGLLTAQYGFIAHELAHDQVFRSSRLNSWLGLIVANLFAGLSYGFWLQKHNRHHGKPNMIDSDPDINLRIIAFSTEQKYSKPAAERFLTRHQGWLFPALIFLTSFDLLLDSFKSLGRKTGRGANLRYLEGAMLVVRLAVPLAAYFLLFPLWAAPLIWLAYMLSFGFFLGAAFAVNHIGMPLTPKGSRIGFFERQVLTSRNITPSPWKDALLGGLNYQVEHHLFPSMARPQLKNARVIVKAYCEEVGVPYREVSLLAGFSEVVSYLNRVGASTKVDPFICPLVAEFRQGSGPEGSFTAVKARF